ncbi:MAG: hypothetical protein PHP69_05590 [Candidatus Omnitrophica bacterium]|nr:hypothetical protein [Candidatus Omnitrophota bacterium]MDD5080620.1 hypothetical protein [Candidatus Omnitrophota bacterium]MDD5441489.1 hypothetical protein [Candidatus Omnitrophota bacterium]
MFAKVILPLAVGKEFDYSFDAGSNVLAGMRVAVNFRGYRRVGIVIAVTDKSAVKNIKPILEILDDEPIISSEKFEFARQLASIYPYSHAEFLFRMVPKYLKSFKKVKGRYTNDITSPGALSCAGRYFYKSDRFSVRYAAWNDKIKTALLSGSVLICLPQESFIDEVRSFVETDFPGKVHVLHSALSDKEFFHQWANSRSNSIIIGLRSAIFYYQHDLRLIIVEDEPNRHYLQEEKPYYNLPDIAGALAQLKNIQYIMSGMYPSIKTYNDIKEKRVILKDLSNVGNPDNIRVLDTSIDNKSRIITAAFKEQLAKTINNKKKAIILFNRTGYNKVIACSVCGEKLNCPRCSSGLSITSDLTEGVCPYCGYKQPVPQVCPKCKEGSIKSYGLGINKVISILHKLFSDITVGEWRATAYNTDICLATSKLFSDIYEDKFDGDGFYLDVDRELSRIDYDATFLTYIMIMKLAFFVSGTLNVFTTNDDHYLFKEINNDWHDFYDYELSLREKFKLPPYSGVAKVIVRSKEKNKLFKAADDLYNRLKKQNIDVYGPMQESPFMLRGNYRYSLVVKSYDGGIRDVIEFEMAYMRKLKVKVAAVIQ